MYLVYKWSCIISNTNQNGNSKHLRHLCCWSIVVDNNYSFIQSMCPEIPGQCCSGTEVTSKIEHSKSVTVLAALVVLAACFSSAKVSFI